MCRWLLSNHIYLFWNVKKKQQKDKQGYEWNKSKHKCVCETPCPKWKNSSTMCSTVVNWKWLTQGLWIPNIDAVSYTDKKKLHSKIWCADQMNAGPDSKLPVNWHTSEPFHGKSGHNGIMWLVNIWTMKHNFNVLHQYKNINSLLFIKAQAIQYLLT